MFYNYLSVIIPKYNFIIKNNNNISPPPKAAGIIEFFLFRKVKE